MRERRADVGSRGAAAENLFTVVGEPDTGVRSVGDSQRAVELRGVDVHDPTIGEVRSGGTDEVALWMVDAPDDGESFFFVRHCYSTVGGGVLKVFPVS